MPNRAQLVCQHLENISGDVLEEYQEIIRQYVYRRQGVYALYSHDDLYYVGLASDLRTRLKAHLKDKHAGQWDRFSVYLTIGDKHLRELEALLLRVIKPTPEGNTKIGKFARSEDLRGLLNKDMEQQDQKRREHIIGRKEAKVQLILPGRMPPLLPYVKRVSKLRGTYKGKTFLATVKDDGTIRFQRKVFRTPTGPAMAITKYPVDGWFFWKYQRAPGDWVRLDELRR